MTEPKSMDVIRKFNENYLCFENFNIEGKQKFLELYDKNFGDNKVKDLAKKLNVKVYTKTDFDNKLELPHGDFFNISQ